MEAELAPWTLLNDELATMLDESARSFLRTHHDLERVRLLRGNSVGFDRNLWREMAALGWFGLLAPENRGGLGFEMAHAALLARRLGAALLPEPLSAAGLIPVSVLSRLSGGLVDSLLREILAGVQVAVLAWQEKPGQISLGPSSVRVRGRNDRAMATGVKRFVHWATGADVLLVSATRDDVPVLVMIDVADAKILRATMIDGAPSGDVLLENASCTILSEGPDVEKAIISAIFAAQITTAAELVGISLAAIARTAEHLRTRYQFGRPIGSFQALQHRLVDHYNVARLADASVSSAAGAFDGAAAGTAALASGAKARASEVAETITAGAIQLHGAIGYTDEHDIGLYLKGALRRASCWGNAQAHRQRAIDLLLPVPA